MNQMLVNEEYKMKCRVPIAILSVLSVICTAISCSTYFADYEYELVMSFPTSLKLVFSALTLAPSVFLAVCVFKFHNNPKKSTMMISSVCLLIVIMSLFGCYTDADFGIYRYGVASESFGANIIMTTLLNLPIRLFMAIVFFVARASALKGFKKKTAITIACTIMIAMGICSLICFFMSAFSFYEENGANVYLFSLPAGYISYILLGGTLLLLGRSNTIPIPLNKLKKLPVCVAPINAEQELKSLNDRRKAGAITEEEYAILRAEIISRL